MLEGMQQEAQLGFSPPGDRGQVLLHSTIRLNKISDPINETSDGKVLTDFSKVQAKKHISTL